MMLNEPHKTWLRQNVGENIDENSRFILKITAKNNDSVKDLDFSFDLAWFILIQVEADKAYKLQVVQELLKQKEFLLNFQATIDDFLTKKLLEEFLLFNYIYLNGLKQYIDFTKLDVPLDFVSHALFIKRSIDIDSKEIVEERVKIVNTILDSGFKLSQNYSLKDHGAAIRKILVMNYLNDKFKLVRKLMAVGFRVFGSSQQVNAENAVLLINSRQDQDCMAIIKENAADFKSIKMRVADRDDGNLADYFYWVKEDMDSANFVKKELGVELSPDA